MYDEIDKLYRSPRVHYSCQDYKTIFEQFKDDEKALLFLDPPYFNSFNAKYSDFDGACITEDGMRIDNTRMYVDILNLLKSAKCRVIMIINKSALLDELYRDFIGEQYDKIYSLTHKSKTGNKKHSTGHMVVTNIGRLK